MNCIMCVCEVVCKCCDSFLMQLIFSGIIQISCVQIWKVVNELFSSAFFEKGLFSSLPVLIPPADEITFFFVDNKN